MDIKKLKVAIISDRLTDWGGAEDTVKRIHGIFPKATIFTSVYDKEFVEKRFPKAIVKATFVQKLPFQKFFRKEYTVFYPIGFRKLNLNGFDLIISVSSAFAKCITVPKKAKHIFFNLTPPMFLWQEERRQIKKYRFTYNIIYKLFKAPLHRWMKKVDLAGANSADVIVSNSKVTQERAKRVYGKDSLVFYPPIDLTNIKFNSDISSRKQWFLYFGRVETYKGVELAIRACVSANQPLVIAGRGSDSERLIGIVEELKAKQLIRIENRFIPDEEKYELLMKCKALIFPVKDEDAGMIPVEANAAGAPVIAHRSGGVVELLSEENPKTCDFFDNYSWEALKEVIEKFDSSKFNPDSCRKQANQFAGEIFDYKVISLVKDVFKISK